MTKSRKGQFSGRVGFVLFSIFFIVLVSLAANQLRIDSVNCSDPSSLISEPGENATTVDKVVDPANSLVDVFFGCSSQNQVLNGIFTALKAGMIIILLFIVKDLVPFT